MSTPADAETKILNLMQFARKAGKLVAGADACIRAMHRNKLYLIVIAEDTATRSTQKILREIEENKLPVASIQMGNQISISNALGLPLTGILGISDKQFAVKMMEYWTAKP
ncbi:MAG: ribosomal L7Ae/L30e/S12e/Gadd45 family protein [Candidatus Cloacimonadaceae bacterium]|nr:ribosomal L7Ae/L30e/S12e/Gadd45 family protein [Candidatus Cloacimonadaceae bacterium]